MVAFVEEGVKRDAPNNGTHTALSYVRSFSKCVKDNEKLNTLLKSGSTKDVITLRRDFGSL